MRRGARRGKTATVKQDSKNVFGVIQIRCLSAHATRAGEHAISKNPCSGVIPKSSTLTYSTFLGYSRAVPTSTKSVSAQMCACSEWILHTKMVTSGSGICSRGWGSFHEPGKRSHSSDPSCHLHATLQTLHCWPRQIRESTIVVEVALHAREDTHLIQERHIKRLTEIQQLLQPCRHVSNCRRNSSQPWPRTGTKHRNSIGCPCGAGTSGRLPPRQTELYSLPLLSTRFTPVLLLLTRRMT
jgi:hypothetical protein